MNFREHMANEPETEDIGVIDAVGTDEHGRLVELRVHFRQECTLSLEAASFERGVKENIRSVVKIIDRGGLHIVTVRLKSVEIFALIGLPSLIKNLLVLMESSSLRGTHE